MIGWLIRRGLQAVLTFAAAIVILFFLMRVTPGDPLMRMTEDRQISVAEMARLKHRFGLDQPLALQFITFTSAAIRGDLGVSIYRYPDRVLDLIVARLPASLLLGGTVLLLNFTIGVWLGVLQAARRGQFIDRWLTRLSLSGYAMPSFWLALVLVYFLSTRWRLLPSAQMTDPLLDPSAPFAVRTFDLLRHLLMPAFTLAIVTIAATMQYQRTAMLEVLRLDFVLAARARGLTESQVRWRHAWRNALFPVLTLFGLWLPILVSGSVFVERIFNWPGLGSLAWEAINGRDYPLLLGTSMIVTLLVILGGVCTDLGYWLLDPRVRRP